MKRPKSMAVGAVVVIGLALSAVVVVRHERARAYQWHRVESPDGTFAVEFPGIPVSRDEPTTSDAGDTFTAHSLNTRASEHAAYGCSWWEDPSLNSRPPEQILDRMTDRSAVSSRRTTVQGHPATDVQAWGRGNTAFDNRVVVVGTRIYSLIVIDTSGKRDSKNVERFFSSLTLH